MNYQLGKDDMYAMVFANFCQHQPDLSPLGAAVLGLEDAEQTGDNAAARAAAIAKLERGAKLLKGYQLVFAPERVFKGLQPLTAVPDNAVGALMIDSGHLATAPAERLVYALPRQR